MQQGMLSRIGDSVARPSAGMSWPQLGASVVFVLAVLMLWRQVIRWGMQEI
jgi:hypothetical protein